MGRFFIVLCSFLILILSCSQKPRDIKAYERENPYPGQEVEEKRAKGSLFAGDRWVNLYGANRASQPGDVIFVRVIESLNAVESVSTELERSTEFATAISSFFGLPQSTLANLGAEGEGEFASEGASRVRQRGLLVTRLAGRVLKVYPNGTMLIEAKKYIVVGGMRREFVLRGVIRPEDIDSTNTVTSDRIANMEVFLDGKGYVAEGGKPGWLARIFARIFPF
ncbi:MAG: flagellar basal body L-ring protein FlgH [Aquificota bacterium]|nr:flagellar basal body L-ring protein FlgH [Aquificota bacterium]